MTDEAFADLRVLDLTREGAGAYCTKWFADFGAEVIKIEPPAGDPTRALGPFPNDVPNPETGGPFLFWNTGKKSVTLNLDQHAGREILRRLVTRSNVLIEDFAPGVMARWGLGYEDLKRLRPELVFVSISNFGQTGPYRDFPATELTLAAFSGTMVDRRLAGRNPIKMGGSQGAYIAGRVAFVAAMGAVLSCDATGQGQSVDISMVEALATNDLVRPTVYSYNGVVHQPRQQPSARGRGGQGRYPCADGWVDVMPGVGGLKKLAQLLGDPSLADHELFTNHQLRAERAEEFDREFMTPWFDSRTRDEIVEQAQSLGMPFSSNSEPAELLSDPQLAYRGYFVSIDHPRAGSITLPGAPAVLSETPWKARRAPLLGESNQEILTDLGYSCEELVRLREEGVI